MRPYVPRRRRKTKLATMMTAMAIRTGRNWPIVRRMIALAER